MEGGSDEWEDGERRRAREDVHPSTQMGWMERSAKFPDSRGSPNAVRCIVSRVSRKRPQENALNGVRVPIDKSESPREKAKEARR